MPLAGPNTPASGANDASIGTIAWVNPGNVTADDAAVAGASLASSEATQYLKALNPGFSVPAGATIDGLRVTWQKGTDGGGAADDNAVRIVKGGTIGATDRSNGAWESSAGVFRDDAYGGATDLWGETWTPADVNAADFGGAISAVESTGLFGATPKVDVVTFEVWYTTGIAGGSSPGHRRARKQVRRQVFHTGASPAAEDVVVMQPARLPLAFPTPVLSGTQTHRRPVPGPAPAAASAILPARRFLSDLRPPTSDLRLRRPVPGPAAAISGAIIPARRIGSRLSTLDSRLATRRRGPQHTGQTPNPVIRGKRRAVPEVRGQRSEISVRRRVSGPGAAAAVAGRIVPGRRLFADFRPPTSDLRLRRPLPNPGAAAAVAGKAVPARRLRAHNPDSAFREPLSFRHPLPNPGAAAAVAGGVPRRRLATNAIAQRPLPTSHTLRRRHPRFVSPPAGVVIRSRRQLVAPTRGDLRFLWRAYDSRPPWLLGLTFGAFARLNGFEIPKHRGRRFGAFAKE